MTIVELVMWKQFNKLVVLLAVSLRSSSKDSSVYSSARCDDLNKLRSTGAGCHDETASHLTAFVAQNKFSQTSINVLLNNQQLKY